MAQRFPVRNANRRFTESRVLAFSNGRNELVECQPGPIKMISPEFGLILVAIVHYIMKIERQAVGGCCADDR